MPTARRIDAVAYAWRALHDTPPPPELNCGPATIEDAQAEAGEAAAASKVGRAVKPRAPRDPVKEAARREQLREYNRLYQQRRRDTARAAMAAAMATT